MASTSAQSSWLEQALAPLPKLRIAVLGDFCLDAYWPLDTESTELSVETGLPVRRVQSQRYSLGGAGNVVANLLDLGVGHVQAVGIVGTDLFGGELLRLLRERGVDTGNGMVEDPAWQTMVYVKPCSGEVEENRIDFGAFNALSEGMVEHLIAALEKAASANDVVILNQQVPAGVSNQEVIARINAAIAKYPKTHFVVDARHRADLYRGAILKLNTREAAHLLQEEHPDSLSVDQVRDIAQSISRKTGKPTFVTRGEHGLVVADGDTVHEVPGIQVVEKTDTVGAGDAVVAALAAVLGSGQPSLTAARLANIAAMITVRKLQITGTATPAEILAVGPQPDYIYEPDLAESPRLAHYLPQTEIEIIGTLPEHLDIQHCIFDHDGTLSTLREGWEKIMEPMMIQAVLGPSYTTASPALFSSVTKEVRTFIDRTTGIQTLVQMKGLVELVRRSGFVNERDILDEHGYKRIYNDELLKMVQTRMDKLQSGELESKDFQIKNAELLLKNLHQRGIKMYLASGTDEADVIAEATAMGYAHYFEGRIFGAVGDINVEAKKVVLERIIRDYNLSGHQFATFGDGPVELRETRKRGGLCVGLATDEVRRFGWNASKRTRVIRAGANIVVSDFSQLPALLKALQIA